MAVSTSASGAASTSNSTLTSASFSSPAAISPAPASSCSNLRGDTRCFYTITSIKAIVGPNEWLYLDLNIEEDIYFCRMTTYTPPNNTTSVFMNMQATQGIMTRLSQYAEYMASGSGSESAAVGAKLPPVEGGVDAPVKGPVKEGNNNNKTLLSSSVNTTNGAYKLTLKIRGCSNNPTPIVVINHHHFSLAFKASVLSHVVRSLGRLLAAQVEHEEKERLITPQRLVNDVNGYRFKLNVCHNYNGVYIKLVKTSKEASKCCFINIPHRFWGGFRRVFERAAAAAPRHKKNPKHSDIVDDDLAYKLKFWLTSNGLLNVEQHNREHVWHMRFHRSTWAPMGRVLKECEEDPDVKELVKMTR
ncbi:protein ORF132 [Lake sturgeon herpesvirus]|nr:protein ORF132 [Lake sturgeon herpesvirus]